MKVSRTPLKFLERNQKKIEGDYAFTVDGANTGGVQVGVDIANTVNCDGYLERGARGRDEKGKTYLTPQNERRIRRLTPTECSYLQGFSKDHTKWGVTDYANAKKENAIEILQALREAVGKNKGEGWGFTEFAALLEKEILRQEVHERELQREMDSRGEPTARKLSCQAVGYSDRMWEMWEKEKTGHPPQEQEQIGQLIRELGSIVPKLPYEITQERGWVEYRVKPEQGKGRDGALYSFIMLSDTQRYRQLGNAVSVPVVKAVGLKLLTP